MLLSSESGRFAAQHQTYGVENTRLPGAVRSQDHVHVRSEVSTTLPVYPRIKSRDVSERSKLRDTVRENSVQSSPVKNGEGCIENRRRGAEIFINYGYEDDRHSFSAHLGRIWNQIPLFTSVLHFWVDLKTCK